MNTTGDANRSVRRTKGKLKDALITLMLESPVKDITVREIAELADVSRGTFYLYYRDVYDMVEKLQNMLLDELTLIMGEIDPHARCSYKFESGAEWYCWWGAAAGQSCWAELLGRAAAGGLLGSAVG